MALIGQALIRDVPNEYSIYKERVHLQRYPPDQP
jgi:D-alanyl-D-alanine carboxypeptidase